MLREIIALWKGESFMKEVVETFGEMLTDTEYIFNHAWEGITSREITEDMKKLVYDKDIVINKHERSIRRMIVEHLSINPRKDTSGCLAMISLIKDAERIGDYSKNIFEVGIILKGNINEMKYFKCLSDMQQNISKRFPMLKKAFLESDENIAQEILTDYPHIKDGCSNVLHSLFTDKLSTREAVSTALLTRYLKRINSHMSNIASGIIYPLDKIDFVRVSGGLLE